MVRILEKILCVVGVLGNENSHDIESSDTKTPTMFTIGTGKSAKSSYNFYSMSILQRCRGVELQASAPNSTAALGLGLRSGLFKVINEVEEFSRKSR